MQTPITYVVPPTRSFVQSSDVMNAIEFGGIAYAQSAPPPPPPPPPPTTGIPFSPTFSPVQSIAGLLIR